MDAQQYSIYTIQLILHYLNYCRIVHLDLKGAPLKIAFLERVLSSIKKWGATGILIEWEDSFPYTGVIANIGSLTDASGDGMYTVEEVKHILYCAKENELEV
ncbi:jg10871, partial [Pararge aegeria aegeria]